MKKLFAVLTVLIIVGICIPAVSAAETEIFNETYSASFTENLASKYSDQVTQYYPITAYVIGVENIGGTLTSSTVTLPLSSVSNRASLKQSDYWPITITALNSGQYLGTGEMGYYIFEVGTTDYIRIMLFLDDIELTGFATSDIKYNCFYLGISAPPTGSVSPKIAMCQQNSITVIKNGLSPDDFILANMVANDDVARMVNTVNVYSTVNYQWQNDLSVIDAGDRSKIFLDRTNEVSGYSVITIESAEGIYTDTGSVDIDTFVPAVNYPFTVNVHNPLADVWYNETFFSSGTPDDPAPTNASVTVYVKNSQTGALLADSHIEIQDTTTDPWAEVVNQTLPSGQGIISLTKDTGIHFTQYRIGVTAPGYQQVVPALFFRVTGPTNVVVEMEPIEGGPVNEDNTFVEFYVRDISANPLANAKVNVGGQLRWTNAQGYTQFELPKNASYPYIVTKTGYLTIEGIAKVESDDRYIVNVALMAGAIPTQPTPTITVEPTPTQTTPPIQEDNLIGLSVKGLAKGFGIDYDTALLMFGLMIVFGAGGMVMSSVKGGAMEFIAGSIVGTFVAFALGLIPIWIFIIIAVVFGAYVLRVFVQGGQ